MNASSTRLDHDGLPTKYRTEDGRTLSPIDRINALNPTNPPSEIQCARHENHTLAFITPRWSLPHGRFEGIRLDVTKRISKATMQYHGLNKRTITEERFIPGTTPLSEPITLKCPGGHTVSIRLEELVDRLKAAWESGPDQHVRL